MWKFQEEVDPEQLSDLPRVSEPGPSRAQVQTGPPWFTLPNKYLLTAYGKTAAVLGAQHKRGRNP